MKVQLYRTKILPIILAKNKKNSLRKMCRNLFLIERLLYRDAKKERDLQVGCEVASALSSQKHFFFCNTHTSDSGPTYHIIECG